MIQTGNHSNRFPLLTLLGIALVTASGCNTTEIAPIPYQGTRNGEVSLVPNRGGPGTNQILLTNFTVHSDGTLSGQPDRDGVIGTLNGNMGRDGKLILNMTFGSSHYNIKSDPLEWHDMRGGPTRVLSANTKFTVDNSTTQLGWIELWE